MGYAERTRYRPPRWLRRQVNHLVGWVAGVGLMPANTVRLEVVGRRTGRVHGFALTTATWEGERYLVSLAGESGWVRNLRAAGGQAVIRHRRASVVRTEEIPLAQRPPILKAYLDNRALSKSASGAARDYFGVAPHPDLEELERIADRYPVFRVVSATSKR